jgi:hypothetical protein
MTQLLDRPDIVVGEEVSEEPMPGAWRWLAPVIAVGGLVVAFLLFDVFETDPQDDAILITDGSGTVSLVDPAFDEPVFSIDNAVAAPDAETIYRTKPEGGDTQVDELDASNGAILGSQVVAGQQAIKVVAPNGDAVALMPPDDGSARLYAPIPRETTTITVAWNDETPARTYELDGNFEPETFSLDADTLFLVEFRPPSDPDRYYVRQLDLISGEIRTGYSPEVIIEPAMRGKARAQVMDPEGEFLYTLYSVDPSDAPILDAQSAEHRSFVHVLDLREERSICIFLGDFGGGAEDLIGMGISPDGDTLYVVDASRAEIAVVDTREHRVTEVSAVQKLVTDPESATRPAVAVGDDGRVFVSKAGYVVIELEHGESGFEAVDAIGIISGGPNERINGIDLSADGTQLRFAVNNGVVIYDLVKDSEVARITAPGGADAVVGFVGAPPGTVGKYDLLCAC